MQTIETVADHKKIDPPEGVPTWDVDPYADDILKNPYPYYEELRAKGPFVYIPKYSVLACGNYEEVREVFSDHTRFISSRGVGLQDFAVKKPWRPQSVILEQDPPFHTRTRKVMARELSPKVVRALKDMFLERAHELVDEMLALDSFDLIADFAEEYATTMIPRAVGMKTRHKRHLIDYAAMVFNAAGPDNDLRRNSVAKEAEVVPWIMEACQRENLVPDGLGDNIYKAADAGEITEEEAGMLVRSLLSAGIDTTVNGIAASVYCLAHNPEAYEVLKETPALTRPCFEEVLRITSPVHSFCRTANGDHEVSGVKIEEGTKILCVLGSANMDAKKWDRPDDFIIDRRPVGHVAFGVGIHGCVGQNIARGEVEAVMTAMAEKVGKIDIREEAAWRPNNAIHALDHMQIALQAKA